MIDGSITENGAECYREYEYLGAHPTASGEWSFRVWAPNAYAVSLVGDFCDWHTGIPMNRTDFGGVWEIRIGDNFVKIGDKYKYKIEGKNGTFLKYDPYGVFIEDGENGAAVVFDLGGYRWRDGGWLARRKRIAENLYSEPLNIYELHHGSWKRHENGEPYTYRELAGELAPYVKQMGYTHIELMPVGDEELYGCCGYRVTSYFSPKAKYGTPIDFMDFVNCMHEAGIGVVLDWIPTRFSPEPYGLSEFDGQPLYESGERCGERSVCKLFRRDSQEVDSFLISNAVYWVEKYHVDGLCVDKISSDWDMVKKLNAHLKKAYPDVFTVVAGLEENDAAVAESMGFHFAWNREWTKAAFNCACTDPFERETVYEQTVNTFNYAFDGKCILPVSHCDALGGKNSPLDKMSGDYWQKFAGVRAFMGYMMTYPAKKLSFMGGEIGEFRTWKNDSTLEWFLLDYDYHAMLQHYTAELNQLYLRCPQLWQLDFCEDGFKWINSSDSARGILSYRRIDKNGDELIVTVNITPNAYEDYRIGVPKAGSYCEIFNSDNNCFGGSGVLNTAELLAEPVICDGFENSIKLRVPPLAITILKRVETARTAK